MEWRECKCRQKKKNCNKFRNSGLENEKLHRKVRLSMHVLENLTSLCELSLYELPCLLDPKVQMLTVGRFCIVVRVLPWRQI